MTKIVTVNDVGKVINWDGCDGQAYGGGLHGVLVRAMKKVVYDPYRRHANGTLLNYRFTLVDIGEIGRSFWSRRVSGYGSYGSVGIGRRRGHSRHRFSRTGYQNAIGKCGSKASSDAGQVLKAMDRA